MSEAGTCPLEVLVEHLSGPWTLLTIWELRQHGPRKFGQLRRDMSGVTSKMLAERLRVLQRIGLVDRAPGADRLRTVTYSLSREGARLYALLDPVFAFACEHQAVLPALSRAQRPARFRNAASRSA